MLATPSSRLFTTAAGSALWAPEVPCLMLRLQGRVSLPQYQALLDKSLDLYAARAHPGTPANWIADARHLAGLPPAARRWMAADWNPRAYAAGLRHLRFVELGTGAAPITQQLCAAIREAAADTTLWLTQHDTLENAIQQARKAATVALA